MLSLSGLAHPTEPWYQMMSLAAVCILHALLLMIKMGHVSCHPVT